MKRFSETLKWQDPWFRRLSLHGKMLWIYVLDHCDNIGIVELDLALVSNDFKEKVKPAVLEELNDRLKPIGGLKYFIPKFIKFQYGKLSESCPAHKKVLQAVEDHGLLHDSLGYHYPSDRVVNTYRIGREEEENKEESTPKEKPTPAVDPIRIRIGKILGRRESTNWSSEELELYRKIRPVDMDDLELIEEFYAAEFPAESDYRRTSIPRLLKHWNGELDKARVWKSTH